MFKELGMMLGEAQIENAKLKAENKDLKEELEELKEENEYNEANAIEFKQTLTEIKEIAKNGCYDDCGMPLDELSIILQKISECEGNDELTK